MPAKREEKNIQIQPREVREMQRILNPSSASFNQDPEGQVYHFNLDGPLFKKQRELILRLLEEVEETPSSDYEALEGIANMFDNIADQAHDIHGIDCLLIEEARQGFISISDDDLCATCKNLPYNVGGESHCMLANPTWPAVFNESGYAVSCKKHKQISTPGENWGD